MTLVGLYMTAHLWGEELGLAEPYQCRCCHQTVTGPNQHPDEQNAKAFSDFCLVHLGKYPGRMPIELWHFITDIMHQALLRTWPKIHFSTHTKFIYSETRARVLRIYSRGGRHQQLRGILRETCSGCKERPSGLEWYRMLAHYCSL